MFKKWKQLFEGEQHKPLWFQENDLSIFCWKQLLENVSCITELSLLQHLQKFRLQSLSNHFKLVLMKRNLSRPNWCYWRIIQGQLQICPCIILHRLTIAWRLPDDCLSEKLRRKLKQIVFKSWNRASYLLTNYTNQGL